MEYASDQYAQLSIQQHFDGYFLNKIPLMNRLKWRSFVFCKAYVGSLDQKNNGTIHMLPNETRAIDEPYYEVGFGIENIFKIARMDFIWRLTDNEHDGVYKFLVKPSFSFSF